MLTPEEIAEIGHAAEALPRKQAACIEALAIVQKHRRWIDDEALRDIAAHLEMSVDALEGVATFYNHVFRKPVGRHVVRLCDSVSCWMLGYDGLRAALRSELGVDLGGTTPDGRFTLLTIPCLGCCDRAPALMVDDDLHRDLTPATLADVLRRYD
jgi:NADH-quinone oxidoreductase subunit E